MMLRIDEAVSLEFESINIIPRDRERCHSPSISLPYLESHLGAYYEVRLKTRKTAQTGVPHTWTLHANDVDTAICPVRALIRLAILYGEEVTPTGPLFLRVHSMGAVLSGQPVVSSSLYILSAFQC